MSILIMRFLEVWQPVREPSLWLMPHRASRRRPWRMYTLALDHDLDVMPVINKIDLPSADPERVVNEIEDVIGIEAQDAPRISAKNGINVEEVLEQIVKKVPAPHGDPEAPLKALIFDSLYDSYKGVIIFCRLFDGCGEEGNHHKDDGHRS